ncbi:MAG: cache domain-containing protein, partial [Betaproteobacteria bacterium]
MQTLLHNLDPRRSLTAAIGWLAFAISIGIVLVASLWVDDIVRSNLLDMRGRQLDRAADSFADQLNLSFALRLQSVRAFASMLATELHSDNKPMLRKILANLLRASPEFEHIVVADTRGRILVSTNRELEGSSVTERSWFLLGLRGSRIGDVRVVPMTVDALPGPIDGLPGSAIVLVAPIADAKGVTTGVIGIRLSGRWLRDLAASSEDKLRIETGAVALVLNEQGTVINGAASVMSKGLESMLQSTGRSDQKVGINSFTTGAAGIWRVEQVADGGRYLVVGATPEASDPLHALGWRIVVLEPLKAAMRDVRSLQVQITIVLLGLGLLATLLGVFMALRVTRDLEAIARSADAVRMGSTQQIAVPRGRNEAARVGRALHELLTSLQRERGALQALNADLDKRVVARTREVERLAEEARYAAVVRERLKLARDLHDTLAHSMMAMLAEMRLLKRLSATDPGAMA